MLKNKILSSLRSIDAEDVMVIAGFAMLAYGLRRLTPGGWAAILGVVLILAVRPLRRWF